MVYRSKQPALSHQLWRVPSVEDLELKAKENAAERVEGQEGERGGEAPEEAWMDSLTSSPQL